MRHRGSGLWGLGMMVMILTFGMLLFAQSQLDTGRINVVVRDRDGVIPKASVVITNLENGKSVSHVTNKQGKAHFTDLLPGDYYVMVTFTGFADFIRDDVKVTGGSEQTVEALLVLAPFSDSITVTTVNRRVELLRDVAEPTTVIDKTELEDTGARTAKDVLSEQAGSGILVNSGGGQGHVSINGIPNSGVLILVDGRRFLGKNGLGDVNLEDIDMTQFERVEVVKGAGSALYGSEALGGVINFITKKPEGYGITNRFETSYGSYKDTKIGDTFSIKKGDFSGVFYASYRYFDGFDLDPDNPQTIGQPQSNYYTFNTNLEQKISDRVTVRGFADYSLRKIDKYFFTGATQMGEEVYNSKRDITRWTVSPEADILLSQSTLLSVRYTFSKYDREEMRIYDDRVEPVLPWLEYNNELNVTARHHWSMFDLNQLLQTGYEFRNEKMNRENLNIGSGNNTEADRNINVFWAQNEFSVMEQLRVTVGFRYDNYSDFGNEFSPKVSAMYDFSKEHSLRFSYGHGFRAPNFGELYLDLGPWFRGNPNLRPEISDNFTFGYVFNSSYANASIDYFHNRIKDGIVFDFSQFPPGPVTYTNLEEFTARGINSGLTVNLPLGFTPSVAYTFVKREDPEGVEVRNYPRHSAFFKLLWSNPRYGIRANLRAQFNGEIEFDDDTSQPAYQVWNFQIRKKLFETGNYAVSAYAQVDNLLDERDILMRDSSGQPIPSDFQIWIAPRTFLVGISFDLKSF